MTDSIVLACEVMRPELELLAASMDKAPELHFLQQGLHDTPERLRSEVQAAVQRLEEAPHVQRIVLAYGLCGRGLTGVHSHRATLVVPRVHDCIPLLLGQGQDSYGAYSQGGSTFWMSPGWLACSQMQFIRNREARRADYVARFDEDSADYLMEVEAAWLASYKRAALIVWDTMPDMDTVIHTARMVAEDAGLPYAEQPGNAAYLTALLNGGHDPERFFQLAPGHTVDIGADGGLAVCPISATNQTTPREATP